MLCNYFAKLEEAHFPPFGCGEGVENVPDALSFWRDRVVVHLRVGCSHLVCRFEGGADLDQFALSDARAVAGCFTPFGTVLDKLRPEREQTALGGFCGMNGAAIRLQEVTLAARGLAQTHAMARAIDVLGFKGGRGHVQEAGSVFEVVFTEIHPALLLTAFRATANATELKGAVGRHI